VPVSGLSEVTALAGGGCSCTESGFSLAVLKNGTAMAWGDNDAGQLGDGTESGPETCEPPVTKVPCSRTPVPVSGLSEVTAVSAGFSSSLALRKGGTVASWGFNRSGQLGNGTTTSSDVPVAVAGLASVSAISAGTAFGLAVGTLLNLPTITRLEERFHLGASRWDGACRETR